MKVKQKIFLSNYVIEFYISYEGCIIKVSCFSGKAPHKKHLRENLPRYFSLHASDLTFYINVWKESKKEIGGEEKELELGLIKDLISISDHRFILKKYNRILTKFLYEYKDV